MDYHSSKYAFSELTEHMNRLESKFQLNNLYGKDSLQDVTKLCDQNIFSANQKGIRNGYYSNSDDQNALSTTDKTSFEKVTPATRFESTKCDEANDKHSENMKPDEDTNYIVKLEKMSNDELIYAKKIHTESKERKTAGEPSA